MSLVAEVVDAVVGGDTHALEIVAPTGARVAALTVDNDEHGYAEVLAWIAEHTPGPRVIIGLEGTRSYGIGLARAVQAAGLVVGEVERPKRSDRRRGKSDPIDAHLAALHTLRLDASRLPTPRADGDREALRILLSARRELATTRTRQVNRLRALLLTGDDKDRVLARGALTDARLGQIARRRGSATDAVDARVRRGETRRLAIAIEQAGHELKANRQLLVQLVTGFAPDLLDKFGVGPVSAAQPIVSWSHPGRCRQEAALAAGGPSDTDTTAAGTAASTARCTTSPSPAGGPAPAPTSTSPRSGPRERTTTRSAAASSGTSPANCSERWRRRRPLDKHRSVLRVNPSQHTHEETSR